MSCLSSTDISRRGVALCRVIHVGGRVLQGSLSFGSQQLGWLPHRETPQSLSWRPVRHGVWQEGPAQATIDQTPAITWTGRDNSSSTCAKITSTTSGECAAHATAHLMSCLSSTGVGRRGVALCTVNLRPQVSACCALRKRAACALWRRKSFALLRPCCCTADGDHPQPLCDGLRAVRSFCTGSAPNEKV